MELARVFAAGVVLGNIIGIAITVTVLALARAAAPRTPKERRLDDESQAAALQGHSNGKVVLYHLPTECNQHMRSWKARFEAKKDRERNAA